MTVQDLLDLLEDQDPTAEVRLVIQSRWPFQCAVAGVITAREINDEVNDGRPDGEVELESDYSGVVSPDTVYITEGEQLGYGSKRAWR